MPPRRQPPATCSVCIDQSPTPSAHHVLFLAARIFLSIRRTTANPLLETLDSLVTSAAASANGGSSSASSSAASGAGASGGEGSQAAAPAAPLDERPQLGDLPEAVRFCELLMEGGRGAVLSATLGVRLQSRASSQELEVYLVRSWGRGWAFELGMKALS